MRISFGVLINKLVSKLKINFLFKIKFAKEEGNYGQLLWKLMKFEYFNLID